ncbi:DUF3080 domain-containing protein [Rheinheimera sp. 4Y26]|uniref:DUF3080 domain-containing protein n=1 Tax=Rheinheimera sp. 4Y26 TaxID=2977811 RepID=UPI0021B111C2|nr:DUF3080 domain-containing protein [Rheinheimera sp. 4Y26]MCT6699538.1 DUF3080 domain-containing protein [Rheinheimera sp. 4Y26]
MANNKTTPQNQQHLTAQPDLPSGQLFYALLPLLLCVTLNGCSKSDAEDLWLDYHSRLQRMLALPELDAQLAAVPELPQVRTLYKPLPDSKLNLLDLVVLRRCGLQQLVAERNNSLGKTMTVANQLGYELQLISQLKPCLQHPELDADLQQKLQQIYLEKQQQLPGVLANFLLTDQTLRQQLHGSQRGIKSGVSITTTLTALAQLGDLQDKVQKADLAALTTTDAAFINQQVGALYQSQILADWQYSLRVNNSWLSALNAQLDTVDLDLFCKQPQVKDKTEILNNILLQQFIGKIQPRLAELDGMSQQLQPALNRIYQQSPIATVLYQRTEAQHQALKQQLSHHVAWWQRLQQHCQFKIAAKTGES